MKKKILIIGPCHPYRGGNALFISYLYEALKEQFDVEMINYKLLYPKLLFPGVTQYDVSEEHFSNIPSKRMVNSIGPLSWYKTARYISKSNPDLVVFDWWQPFFGPAHRAISSLIHKRFKNRILFITENVISHEARWIDRFLTRLGLKHADKFLALSKIVEEDLKPFKQEQKVYRSELPVFGWFKDSDKETLPEVRKALGFNEDHTIILFFGYVRRYKGLDILLQAFSKIQEERPDLRLLVAGEFYDNPKPYETLVEELGISDKTVIVNQYIPNEKVADYFNISEVIVLPYRSATQSGILNIAYGYEKPMVTTNVGGLSEFVHDGKTGVLVENSDPDSIVDGINRYFDLKKTVDFRQNIREIASQNSFAKIVDVFQDILNDSDPIS